MKAGPGLPPSDRAETMEIGVSDIRRVPPGMILILATSLRRVKFVEGAFERLTEMGYQFVVARQKEDLQFLPDAELERLGLRRIKRRG